MVMLEKEEIKMEYECFDCDGYSKSCDIRNEITYQKKEICPYKLTAENDYKKYVDLGIPNATKEDLAKANVTLIDMLLKYIKKK